MSDIFEKGSIATELLRGGRSLGVDPKDNYVLESRRIRSGFVDLHVRVDENARAVAFMVDGAKGVVLKHEASVGDRRVVDPGRHYKLRMQIKQTNPPPDSGRPAGIPHTEYPSNAMRILEVRPDGSLLFWSISLVSQWGEFFLMVQDQYDVRCYQEDGAVRCPYFEGVNHDWPQIRVVLPKVFEIVKVTLPPYRGERAEPDYVFPKLAPGTAGVEHWDAANQLGGIITDTGKRARVHWTSIDRPGERRVYLAPGEIVSYEELVDPVLTKERETKYDHEAKGVRVIDYGTERAA